MLTNQTGPSQVLSSFSDALREHLNALQARDIERFAATLGREVAVVDGRGALRSGTGAVVAAHAEWFASSDPWAFAYEIVLNREFAGAGFALLDVTYRQRPNASPARFLLTLVFAREPDGLWKFVFDQNTTLDTPAG